MIDPRLLRDDPDRVRAAQAKRRLSDDVVDRALAADSARRQAIADFESKRAEQKASGALVAKAQGEEKQALLAQVKELAAGVKEAEAARAAAEAAWDEAIRAIPNIADDAAPAGLEDDYTVIEQVGTPREFDFEPRDHVELGQLLGAFDLERGAKVSRLALLLPHRHRRPAPAGAGQHGDGPGPRRRLHPDGGPLAGTPPRDGGHRLPRPGRRRRLPDRGRGPLPRRHLRGADGGLPLRRDPRRRRAPAALRRVQPVLPQGGRLARQGHPRDLAGALVRQGRDVRLHDRSRSPTPSTSGCWSGRRSSSTSSSSATGSSTPPPATSG